MKEQKNRRKFSKIEIIVACGAAFITILIISLIVGAATQLPATNAPRGNAEKQQEPPKEDTSDLNLSIKPFILSLEITSNEPSLLENCEVRVNDGYTTRADLPPGKAVDIDYKSLTKNAEKFDTNKYAVETVVVERCKGQTARMGIYGTQKF